MTLMTRVPRILGGRFSTWATWTNFVSRRVDCLRHPGPCALAHDGGELLPWINCRSLGFEPPGLFFNPGLL